MSKYDSAPKPESPTSVEPNYARRRAVATGLAIILAIPATMGMLKAKDAVVGELTFSEETATSSKRYNQSPKGVIHVVELAMLELNKKTGISPDVSTTDIGNHVAGIVGGNRDFSVEAEVDEEGDVRVTVIYTDEQTGEVVIEKPTYTW